MSTKDIIELLTRYEEGGCTDAEKRLIDQWFEEHGATDIRFDHMDADQQKQWVDALFADITQVNEDGNKQERKIVRLWPRIAVAAAAIAVIVVGVYFFNASRHANTPRHPELVSGSQDIAPGKNGATITLANGKVIALSDAKSGVVVGKGDLKYSDGSPLSPQGGSLPEGERSVMLTASTAKGQTYQFTLPDGTKVWLNANSKISFPSRFPGEERKILLDGEAYFEVAKIVTSLSTEPMPGQPSKPAMLFKVPFFVESKGQTVEVLGTHFNINAYKDERLTTTTLVEGSVRVSAFDVAAGRRTEILKPNQQSIQTPSGGMQVRNVDVSEALDWKNGEFIFKREPLQNIMRRVTRWYDVQIIYESGVDVNETFSGVVSRTKNISEILNLMGLNGQLKFKIEGKKVYVGR